MELTQRQHNTVLAALRYWQHGSNGPSPRDRVLLAQSDRTYGGPSIERLRDIAAIATDGGTEALTSAEIDHLIDCLQSAAIAPDAEPCDECGWDIPVVEGGQLANRHHADNCSLYDPDSN